MKKEKKLNIIKRLNSIAQNIPDFDAWKAMPLPKAAPKVGDRVVFLNKEALETINQVYDDLEKEADWHKKFSRDYIEEEIIYPTLDLILKSEDTNTFLDTLISQCDQYAEIHTAYIPIENIAMEMEELRLGNIILKEMRGTYFKNFEQQVKNELERHFATQEECEERFYVWHKLVKPVLEDRIVAVYTDIAEPIRLQTLAEQECTHVINVLRYFIFVSETDRERKSNPSLAGGLQASLSQVIVASSTYDFSVSIEAKGPMKFGITKQVYQEMIDTGILDLLIMEKTEFNKILLAGIYWVANALIQTNPANEFLGLVSCLETFLTRERADLGSISNAVAGGVAWVLGHSTEERINLAKEIKEIYGMRSSISHGKNTRGKDKKKSKTLEELLPRLRDIVKEFMQQMVKRRNEFQKSGQEGLFTWIDQGPIRLQ